MTTQAEILADAIERAANALAAAITGAANALAAAITGHLDRAELGIIDDPDDYADSESSPPRKPWTRPELVEIPTQDGPLTLRPPRALEAGEVLVRVARCWHPDYLWIWAANIRRQGNPSAASVVEAVADAIEEQGRS